MQVENRDIRLYARANDVPLWRIASAMKISEPTISRRLRQELTQEEKSEIRAIIENLKVGESNDD